MVVYLFPRKDYAFLNSKTVLNKIHPICGVHDLFQPSYFQAFPGKCKTYVYFYFQPYFELISKTVLWLACSVHNNIDQSLTNIHDYQLVYLIGITNINHIDCLSIAYTHLRTCIILICHGCNRGHRRPHLPWPCPKPKPTPRP